MTEPSLPGKPPIDKLDSTSAVTPSNIKSPPDQNKFASYMKESASTTSKQQASQNISPMQLQAQQAGSPPTFSSIQAQMEANAGTLGDLKNQLHTKGLKLKQSEKYSLRNKLSDANTHIRSAAQQLGAPVGPPPDLSNKNNPVTKFLELVTDGQSQLNSAAQTLKRISSSGKSVDPASFLLIQVKLQKAQQELDYSSVILGKAIDTLKTLMNIQI